MSNKHTPGPWVSHPHKEQDVAKSGFIVIQDRRVNAANIATVIPCLGMKKEEVEANANLIAAAPELLEALQNLNTAIDNYWNSSIKPDSLVKLITRHQQQALHIIKKATS